MDKLKKLDAEYDFVFIIESLGVNEDNLKSTTIELSEFLRSKDIKNEIARCHTKQQFLQALDFLVSKAEQGERFLLHIVCHGNESGIQIRESNEFIFWPELRHKFNELNKLLDNSLLVNMATCKGLHGIRIVDELAEDYPFFGLLGSSQDLTLPDAKAANLLFYTGLIEGKDIAELIPEIQRNFEKSGKKNVILGISAEGYSLIKKTISSSEQN